jgi:hypothetical protein
LGGLLRHASDLLEHPILLEAQQTEFAGILQHAAEWTADEETRLKHYRQALVHRRRSPAVPDKGSVEQWRNEALKERLLSLLEQCPADAQLGTDRGSLRTYDQTLEQLILLWRERRTLWATDLAQACKADAALPSLYNLVDQRFWEHLKEQAFKIECDTTSSEEQIEAFNLTEFRLTSTTTGLTARMRSHPLQVVWRIVPQAGTVRTVETDDVTLVQYFRTPGQVCISAVLHWQGQEIPVKEHTTVKVVRNPELSTRRILGGGAIEWSVLAVAVAFAVATAMSTQYDATFGSSGQYLALLLWAAGAGSGGNMFKQLSATSTVGGQAESALPAPAAPGRQSNPPGGNG